MPFRKIPPTVRETLEVHGAWLESHSERLDALESLRSKSDTAPPSKPGGLLPRSVTRPIILGLLLLTATGIVPLEKAIKLIALLIRLSVG